MNESTSPTGETAALRNEVERLRRELDTVYASNTWKSGSLLHRALGPSTRVARRLRAGDRSSQTSGEVEPGSGADGQRPDRPLSEDLERRATYQALLDNTSFAGGSHHRILLLVSTTDLDAGRGDLFVAAGLGLALRDRDCEVVIACADGPVSALPDATACIALVPDIDDSVFDGPAAVIGWVRNETDRWCRLGHIARFDGLLASSALARHALADVHVGPHDVLPIGVDTTLFHGEPGDDRLGVTSTVNQWGRERELFRALKRIPLDMPLDLHGRHLALADELAPHRTGPTSFFALPSLYRQATLVLDDFNHSTVGYGNVNSRLFEALAAGAMVTTNGGVGLADLGLERVPQWSTPARLQRTIRDVLAAPDWSAKTASELQAVVRSRHSYERRADQLLEFLAKLPDGPRSTPAAAQNAPSEQRNILAFYPDYSLTNPYQTLLYGGFAATSTLVKPVDDPFDISELDSLSRTTGRFVYHLHWTAPILGPASGDRDAEDRLARFLDQLDRVQTAGGSIVWTVHNVMPHECARPELELRLRREIVERADIVHVLSRETVEAIGNRYPIPPSKLATIEHGNYVGVYPDLIDRSEARSLVGLREHDEVLLYLGGIRPYRGLDTLLNAFDVAAATRPDLRLLVAGRAGRFPGVVELEERCRADERVLSHFNAVPDDELQVFFQAADVAVLPYQQVLNSGSVMLALSFGCPVIAPQMGALQSVLDSTFSSGYDPSDPNGLLGALDDVPRLRTNDARRAAHERALRTPHEEVATRFADVVFPRDRGLNLELPAEPLR